MIRLLWLGAGWLLVAVGVIGAVLPAVPTTFPMILALACFARSSERFHRWLYHHPRFGPPLQRWDRHHVIPPAAKLAAVLGMTTSAVILATTGALPAPAFVVVLAFMSGGAVYILTRPSRAPADEGREA